jgi:protease-4
MTSQAPSPDAPAPQTTAIPESASLSSTSSTRDGAAAVPALERSVDRLTRELAGERRRDRRWRVFFRLAWLLLAIWVVWMLSRDSVHPTAPVGPHTALVELRGEIAPDTEAAAESVIAGLRSAFEDAGAKAVVLRINSPGGSPVQSGIVNDEIRRLKALHDKKLYVVVEELCASAAYYVAVAADEIFVDKASIVGSIGVVIDGFGYTGLMDKAGVERRLIIAGSNKAMLDPFSPEKPEHRAHAQAMIDQVHQQFIAVVRQGRGERLKETAETFSGMIWNGEEAVRQGLVDRLGSLDYVAREVIKAEEIIDYTPRENVAERLARRFGAAMGEGAARVLGSAVRLR